MDQQAFIRKYVENATASHQEEAQAATKEAAAKWEVYQARLKVIDESEKIATQAVKDGFKEMREKVEAEFMGIDNSAAAQEAGLAAAITSANSVGSSTAAGN